MKKNFADYHTKNKKKVVKKKVHSAGVSLGSLTKATLVDLDYYFKKFFTPEELQSFEYDRTSNEPKHHLITDLRMYREQVIKKFKLTSRFIQDELTWSNIVDYLNFSASPEIKFRELKKLCQDQLDSIKEKLPSKQVSADDYSDADLEEITTGGVEEEIPSEGSQNPEEGSNG